MNGEEDLFGAPGAPAQLSTFGQGEDKLPPAPAKGSARRSAADLAEVRRRLNKVLGQAREASEMPWQPREAAAWKTIFPQMAGALPPDEAQQLRLDFAAEIERLERAA